ncbi:MAG: cupin domain-containing protein [Eubacteriales bacterium]
MHNNIPYSNSHYYNNRNHEPDYLYDYYFPYPNQYYFDDADYKNDAHYYDDYGPEPFIVDIEAITKENDTFRTALWTGRHLQLTLMSIDVGEDIGLETHPHLDQFIRIEEGQGIVKMGDSKDNLDFQEMVYDDFAILIPAGKWHNLINTGYKPIKLYSIYAPPEHPFGTVHVTKREAEAAEENHNH